MKKIPNELFLLPVQFKKLAIGILVISILLNLTGRMKITSFDVELLKSIATMGLLISFLLFALTKNKIEDELTIKIRMISLAAAFIFGVLEVIFQPIFYLIIEGQYFFEMNGVRMLIHMFLAYFVMSFVLKRKR